MPNITITDDTMRFITLFENVTRAQALDCIDKGDLLIFVVPKNQVGLAVGKQGENIRKLKDMMKKSIEVVGFSRNLESFLRSIFHNYKVTGVKVEEKDNVSYARVAVDPSQKGRAIGKGGSNLRQAKEIVNRYFDRTEITIE